MDKEKQIERMAEILERAKITACAYVGSLNQGFGMWYAKALADAGYDNVKQAVKEFANNVIDLLDEMGMERSSEYNDGYDDGVADCITNIKNRLTELYGADEL